MKKIVIFTLALMLLATGAQAQKKNTGKSSNPNVNVDGKQNKGTKPATNLTDIVLSQPEIGFDAPLFEAFRNRQSTREFLDMDLPNEIISSLLWSAYGFNRKETEKRVVPSAINVQEFDIYLFTHQGIYQYDAQKMVLHPIKEGDHRAIISAQKHFTIAPISFVIVANYDRMEKFKETADRDFYAAVDAGYVSQNIYLFCASAHLGTVACGGINREDIAKILGITNGRAILAHPVGIPAK